MSFWEQEIELKDRLFKFYNFNSTNVGFRFKIGMFVFLRQIKAFIYELRKYLCFFDYKHLANQLV